MDKLNARLEALTEGLGAIKAAAVREAMIQVLLTPVADAGQRAAETEMAAEEARDAFSKAKAAFRAAQSAADTADAIYREKATIAATVLQLDCSDVLDWAYDHAGY